MARPENPIPDDAPHEFAELARELRALRRASGLTYKQLSNRCHNSAASLSTAASGTSVPTWDVVQSFVRGCSYTGDMEQWYRLHRAAQRRAAGISSSEDTGETPLPRQGRNARKATEGAPQSDTLTIPASDGLFSVVQQFMEYYQPNEIERVTSPRADYWHTALALCTYPDDFIVLMRELVSERNMTIRQLEERSKVEYPISSETFSNVLGGRHLPTTELLHIFLTACGVPEEKTLIWHHTLARIKIAEIRTKRGQGSRSIFRGARRPVHPPRILQTSTQSLNWQWWAVTAPVLAVALALLTRTL